MTNIITSCPQVSHSPQISSKCRHKCHHSQISLTSTSPSISIVDGHSTGPTTTEVCPELEVCHEHHSPPPIAPAQKRSDCMCETRFKVGSKNLKKSNILVSVRNFGSTSPARWGVQNLQQNNGTMTDNHICIFTYHGVMISDQQTRILVMTHTQSS